MPFLDAMQTYFRGERIEALGFILPAGLVLIAFAAVALRAERGGFAWGLSIPLALFGAVAVIVGLSVGLRTPAQVAEIQAGYATDPAAMVADELPRMEKVNQAWPAYISAWAAFVIIGFGLRFGIKSDWAHGLGPALMLVGAIGFLIDGFAERRARPYTQALQTLAAEHPATGSSTGGE